MEFPVVDIHKLIGITTELFLAEMLAHWTVMSTHSLNDRTDEIKVFAACHLVNPSDAETGKFQEYYVNTIAVDGLAPCVARSSAAMILTM